MSRQAVFQNDAECDEQRYGANSPSSPAPESSLNVLLNEMFNSIDVSGSEDSADSETDVKSAAEGDKSSIIADSAPPSSTAADTVSPSAIPNAPGVHEDQLQLFSSLETQVNALQSLLASQQPQGTGDPPNRGRVGGKGPYQSRPTLPINWRSTAENSPSDKYSQFAVLDETNVSDFAERVPHPALEFSFELDDFQKRAVLCLEQGSDCFVAAHTSAGKTVIAEYAVALAAQNGGRVFYTSPIKSLSNQKFRDFSQKFDSVGIVTGDVSILQESQCLIMTTEILRTMLYRSDDMLRSVDWVVFDECQFVNDEERGVVWETCILMLPPHIGIVMLSATVPNAVEFAAWVGKTRERLVKVVSTHVRPVPLEVSLLHTDMSAGGEGHAKLKSSILRRHGGRFISESWNSATRIQAPSESDSSLSVPDVSGRSTVVGNRSIREEQFRAETRGGSASARGSRGQQRRQPRLHGRSDTRLDCDRRDMSTVAGGSDSQRAGEMSTMNSRRGDAGTAANERGRGGRGRSRGRPRGRGGKKGPVPGQGTDTWDPVVRFLQDRSLTPTIVFCFSKKKCAAYVESLASHDLLPSSVEKSRVHAILEQALKQLQEEDRNLPQILSVREHLKRGIAAHHAGLLPIVKEVTEILFSEGLVKVLFATETFAMGVNFPAKCVVFTGLRKHDGRSFRFLQSGEFTQMSGRAGRRGIDSIGHVFLYFPPKDDALPGERDVRQVITGPVLTLKSAFRLTYNMILNVLLVDELRVEDMMKQSFSEAAGTLSVDTLTDSLSISDDRMSSLDSVASCIAGESEIRYYSAAYVRIVDLTSGLVKKLVMHQKLYEDAFAQGRFVLVRSPFYVFDLGIVLTPFQNSRKPRSFDKVRVLCLVGFADVNGCRGKGHSVLVKPYRKRRPQSPLSNPTHVYDGWIFEFRDVSISDIVWFGEHRITSLPTCGPGLRLIQGPLASNVARTTHFQEGASFLSSVANSLVARTSFRASGSGSSSASARVSSYSDLVNVAPLQALAPITGSQGSEEVLRSWKERDELVSELFKPQGTARTVAIALWNIPKTLKDRSRVLRVFCARETLRSQIQGLRDVINARRTPDLLPEYKKRVSVLQKMRYVGDDGLSVLLKGRNGACEVTTVDCVLLTEILLENVFHGLSAAEIASLLSALVCRKKNKSGVDPLSTPEGSDTPLFSEKYRKAKDSMRSVVRNFGRVQEEAGVELDFEIADCGNDYEDAMCRWALSEVVYRWASGESFKAVAPLTDVQEGDIVVTVKRLVELLKDAKGVAKAIGNEELHAALDQATEAVRRDIIFSGSLYLS